MATRPHTPNITAIMVGGPRDGALIDLPQDSNGIECMELVARAWDEHSMKEPFVRWWVPLVRDVGLPTLRWDLRVRRGWDVVT